MKGFGGMCGQNLGFLKVSRSEVGEKAKLDWFAPIAHFCDKVRNYVKMRLHKAEHFSAVYTEKLQPSTTSCLK